MTTECEICEGTGKVKCNAIYINGDLYKDSEIIECEECNGTGQVEDYSKILLEELKIQSIL